LQQSGVYQVATNSRRVEEFGTDDRCLVASEEFHSQMIGVPPNVCDAPKTALERRESTCPEIGTRFSTGRGRHHCSKHEPWSRSPAHVDDAQLSLLSTQANLSSVGVVGCLADNGCELLRHQGLSLMNTQGDPH
jgi:hypothetical protein